MLGISVRCLQYKLKAYMQTAESGASVRDTLPGSEPALATRHAR